MATVATQLNSGSGFASGEIVTATKLNNLVNTATVTGIVNADVDAAAAIAASKLALTGAITNTALASSAISGQTSIADPLADGDEFLVHDASASELRRVPWSSVKPLTLKTAQNSTSGTSIDFTSIPSWSKRVTVILHSVSLSGTAQPIIQVGNGTVVTTGYVSSVAYGTTRQPTTSGFYVASSQFDFNNNAWSGSLTLLNVTANKWVGTGIFTQSDFLLFCAGKIDLSAALDVVRVTSTNGTDTFDAGTINVSYE